MENQEQVQRLRTGVVEWNTWRKEHPEIRPDLRGAYLIGADLRGADLSEAYLFRAYLFRADLIGADLFRADLSEAYLIGANLRGTNLSGVNLSSASLNGASLNGAYLNEADLNEADLSGAYLFRADLSGAYLFRADLSRAYLRGADLSEADLNEANLRGADLSGVNLSEANLSGVNLSEANLSRASLGGANLSRADLSEANLSGVNLSGVNLSEANLSEANLGGANLSRADLSRATIDHTQFEDRDFREVKGLETVIHRGPSSLSINSLYLSEGQIPEAFVRGTGAPEVFVEYMRSLVHQPIKYYTCFLCYSSKDEDFARRLYTDLRANQVECWFAPEDMKIGDKIRQRIDDSIHVHDKLLLILSQNAIVSSWVEEEVETAFEKEARQKRLVFFPVRIDEAIMHAAGAWATSLRRSRHIGDFTHWKDYDAYQQGLQRLLRDLKAE